MTMPAWPPNLSPKDDSLRPARIAGKAIALLGLASLFPAPSTASPTLPARAIVAYQSPSMLPDAAIIAEAAQRYGIPESWIGAVMRVESAGDPRAVSPKGAMGLMQIMPATWARMTARYGLGSDPFDMRANIHAGAAYLREMFDRYHDLATALAAYNAGPGRADDWRWRGRPLPAETRAYVARIAPASGTSGISGIATLAAVPVAGPSTMPPSWRASELFATASRASATHAGDDDGAPAGGTPQRVYPAVVERASAPSEPRHTSLFVALVHPGAP